MRVAFLSASYPSSPGDGVGHFVRAEARAAAAEGHDVHVVAPAPHERDAGVCAHAVGASGLFAWPGAVARARQRPVRVLLAAPFALRAARALRAIGPERVVAHWIVPAAAPIALAGARSAELEVVCHGADVRLLLALPAALRGAIVGRVVARAERLRFVAASLLEALGAGLDAAGHRALLRKAIVALPRVDVGERAPPGAERGRYVVVAGRLIASKRVELAILAVARSPEPLSLVILGDGPELASLRARAAAEAPGRVWMPGRVSRPEALGWIAGAAALLHPSSTEAAPTAVLEARALGVPVIACGAGDLTRWAASDGGLRVVGPTALAMALAVAELGPGPIHDGRRPVPPAPGLPGHAENTGPSAPADRAASALRGGRPG